MFSVYVATHRDSGRHYVGKSTNPRVRWINHRCHAKTGKDSAPYFHKALRKYGPDSFDFVVVESFDLESDAYGAESWWIEFLRSDVLGYGFNLTHGGLGGDSERLKKLWSDPAWRANAVARMRGVPKSTRAPISDETRRKISESQRGRPRNDRQLAAMMATVERQRGTTLSDEHRAKDAEAMRRKWADPQFREKMLAKRASKRKGTFLCDGAKVCGRCHRSLSASDFFRSKHTPDGLVSRCKSCWHTRSVKEST